MMHFSNMLNRTVPAAVIALGGFVAGCGKSEKAVVPVHGHVLVQAKPAERALVIFTPLTNASRDQWPMGFPRGAVKADGSFKLTTYRPDDGAPPGDYKVTVLWWNSESDDEEPRIDQLQGRYANPETSPFQVKITADRKGNTLEPFNLD